MNRQLATASTWIILLLTLASSQIGEAQTVFELPIVNPGARSLGLGGAFVALADDATAAWANPSGLMQLARPEISAELRVWSDDRDDLSSNASSLGFASFVLPRRSWSVAVYGQTLASVELPADWTASDGVLAPLSSLVIANGGVSAAVRLGDDLSLGVGLTVFAGTFSKENLVPSSESWDDDLSADPGVTAGLLFSPGDTWAVGASVRSGADFHFTDGSRATIPDIAAAGVRWRSNGGGTTVTAELEHLDGIESRLRLHLGAEWVQLKMKPLIGFRAGAWIDPEGDLATHVASKSDPQGDSVLHVSAGAGIAWKRFQLDIGADHSSRTTIVGLSGIFTF